MNNASDYSLSNAEGAAGGAAHAHHVGEWWDRDKVGMASFLATEAAFFSTLFVAYLTYLGKDTGGPTPGEALHLPLALANTVCLVTSSATIMLAERMLVRGRCGAFLLAMIATVALGVGFLAITGFEWYDLIERQGLTISRNLFGSTYFTLIGFHAAHVTLGLLVMLGVVAGSVAGRFQSSHAPNVKMLSWYWHFVDTVWIVILIVVYVGAKGL